MMGCIEHTRGFRLWPLVLVLLLVTGGFSPLYAAEQKQETLLEMVAKGQPAEVAALVEKKNTNLEQRDSMGRTPLLLSVADNRYDLTEILVAAGADVNSRDQAGQTPLLYALKSRNREIIDLLLNNGANMELRDASGDTALIYASKSSDEEMVALLLDKGVDTENGDNDDWTPLHYAATSGRDDVGIVVLLLARGAMVDAKDKYGYTPLMYAVELGKDDIITLLADSGASLADYPEGKTLVAMALEKGHQSTARLLAGRGAIVDPESAKILQEQQQ